MNEKKIIIVIAIVSAFLLVGGAVIASKFSPDAEVTVNQEAHAATTETAYDWGEIGINNGTVEREFTIKNEGSGDLTLQNVTTSCMCTTAILSHGDEQSPVYGMHSKSNYVMTIPSGEEARLKVIFDPAFHGPSGVGDITRQIIVETNDPENRTLTFNLAAKVVN